MLSKFYGDTDKNIRMLFSEARSKSPSVILFDEIDGLCPVRNHKQEQVQKNYYFPFFLSDFFDLQSFSK